MILGALAMGRAQANARMTETFEFFTTELVFDEATLDDVPTDTVLHTTPGRLKVTANQGRDVESASQFPTVERLEVHIPSADSSAIAPSPWLLPGDVIPAYTPSIGVLVRCIASSADTTLVGRVFRVSERFQAGQTTAHRIAVEEVS